MFLNTLPLHVLSFIKDQNIPVYSTHSSSTGYIKEIIYAGAEPALTISWESGNISVCYPKYLDKVYVTDLPSVPLFFNMGGSSPAVRFFEFKHLVNCLMLEHDLSELKKELIETYGNYIIWNNDSTISDMMFSYANAVYSLEEPIAKNYFKDPNDNILFANTAWETIRVFKQIVYKHTKELIATEYI